MAVLRIENSLATVSTGYTVFEADQVLTHHQLNSVADYADDQIRLSRTRLGGVGIACGLNAALAGGTVTVTGGVGVTTDGDLLYLDAGTVYDRWRPYDASFPAYPPLYQGGNVNGTMHGAWELFPAGTEGAPGRPLGELAAAAGVPLGDLFAVLLMESYRQDDDLCSGTDCDNLGARAVNTRKLLLVERAAVAALRGGQATPAQVYARLPEIAARRAVLPQTLANAAQLSTAYRTACTAIHDRLLEVLPEIFTHAGAVLGGVLPAGTWTLWRGKLADYQRDFSGNRVGIQYYYDFLKDVVEAYNEFRERLFADDTWCSPPITSFPKHLLLGQLTAQAGVAPSRTGWYPSPVTSRTAGELDHARFLAQRLDALIRGFAVGTDPALAIRVTPSAMEDRPLEDRALPFYYAPGGADPVHHYWSWRLARRGAEDATYSYWGNTYASPTSPAADPLAYQVGRATFFRVEGVVGKSVGAAVEALEEAIADHTLPFSVRAVLLGSDRTKIVKRPGRKLTDLHHLHQVIRRDAAVRLDDARVFTANYSQEVLSAVDATDVFLLDEVDARNTVRTAATTSGATVQSRATQARNRTAGSYSAYRQQAGALQADVTAAIEAANTLAFHAVPVADTPYITPLDTLSAGLQTQWLPWIDQVLDWKTEQEDTRLFFSAFARRHPQVEHFGGVARGGTLVLLHDDAGVVVAEVTLPYTCCEEAVDETEPDLTGEHEPPPVAVEPPVRRVPSRKWSFQREWEIKEPEIQVLRDARTDVTDWMESQTRVLQDQISWQTRYLQEERMTLQSDLIRNMDTAYQGVIDTSLMYRTPTTTQEVRDFGVQDLGDELLGALSEAMRQQARTVTILEQAAAAGGEVVQQQLDGARQILTGLVEQTAQRLDATGAVVEAGTAGAAVVQDITGALDALKGTEAFDAARSTIDSLAKDTANRALKGALGRIFKR